MSYLIDTMVLSELRKKERSENVAEWFRACRGVDIFLSKSAGSVKVVVAIHEITFI